MVEILLKLSKKHPKCIWRKNMKTKTNNLSNRLKDVIKKDKEDSPRFVKDVIKSDFFYMINNFFEVEFQDINVEIDIDDSNKYLINISAIGDRAKLLNKID